MASPVTAEITISMDQSLGFTHVFRGHPALIPGLIGAMECCKDVLKDQVLKKADVTKSGACADSTYNEETELTRDRAWNVYAAAALRLKERMEAIKHCPEDATFLVDLPLLESL